MSLQGGQKKCNPVEGLAGYFASLLIGAVFGGFVAYLLVFAEISVLCAIIIGVAALVLGTILNIWAATEAKNGNIATSSVLAAAGASSIGVSFALGGAAISGYVMANKPSYPVVNPTKEKTPAIQLAEEISTWPKSAKKGINTVAVVETQSGCYVGVNQEGVYNETVRQILDSLGVENEFGRQCAEVNAISKALNEGSSLDNAYISVANVRGPSSIYFGTSKDPCDVCQGLIDFFDIFVL